MTWRQARRTRHGDPVDYLLYAGIAAAILIPALYRGLFFREDYLRFFIGASWLFVTFAAIAWARGDAVWRGDVDVAMLLVAVLYGAEVTWAKSKGSAVDGALKYGVYLMVFLLARYIAREPTGKSVVCNALIVSGVVAASVAFLAAAKVITYADAVQGGRLSGSFQYPNSLAAYSMFASFFCLNAWSSAKHRLLSMAYAWAGFLMVLTTVLSYSRAVWMVFVVMSAAYIVLLPKGARFQIGLRYFLMIVPVAAVGGGLSACLPKGDAVGIRNYLALGSLVALALDLGRSLLEKRLPSLGSARVSAPGNQGSPQGPLPLSRGKIRPVVWWLGLLLLLAVIVVAIPGGRGWVSRLVPQSVLKRLASISAGNVSFLVRLVSTRDALAIAWRNPLGTGAGGWNALYHQYQRIPYYFTETHNNLAQVLVEVGFPGLLAYASVWAGSFLLVLRNLQSLKTAPGAPDEDKGRARVSLISSGMGILSLLAHSMADFDLSLPAISLSLYAALGALLGSSSLRQESLSRGQHRTLSPALQALSVALLSLAIFVPSQRQVTGMALGGTGVGEVMAGRFEEGEELLHSALQWDPNTASYAIDIAQVSAQQYLESSDPVALTVSRSYISAARKIDPLNLEYRMKESQTLTALGLRDDATEAAREAVALAPAEPKIYDFFASAAVAAVLGHAETAAQASNPAERSRELSLAGQYAAQIEEIPNTLQEKKRLVAGIYARVFSASRMVPGPEVNLALGQVAFLRGDASNALTYLSAAAKDKNVSAEAGTWLSVLAKVAKLSVALPIGFAADPGQSGAIEGLYGLLK